MSTGEKCLRKKNIKIKYNITKGTILAPIKLYYYMRNRRI